MPVDIQARAKTSGKYEIPMLKIDMLGGNGYKNAGRHLDSKDMKSSPRADPGTDRQTLGGIASNITQREQTIGSLRPEDLD